MVSSGVSFCVVARALTFVLLGQIVSSPHLWAILPGQAGLVNAVAGEAMTDGIFSMSDLDVGAEVLYPGDPVHTGAGMVEK